MSHALRIKEQFRTIVIAGLMLVSILMMGVLGHQTFIAVTSQQQLVESVLKDYSSLAADEFIRRSNAVISHGYTPMLGYLSRLLDGAPLPDHDFNGLFDKFNLSFNKKTLFYNHTKSLRKSGFVGEREKLAQGLFRVTSMDELMEISGRHPPDVVVQRLMVDLHLPPVGKNQNSLVRSFHTIYDGAHYNFVYARALSGSGIVGIWINNDAALDWLEYFVTSAPLLPATLTQDKLENENVFVKLLSGDELIYMQGTYHPDGPSVSRIYGKNEAIYGDMRLTLGIAPDVGPSLIIGGLPSARLPFIYGDLVVVFGGLWFIAAILMVIALVLIFRDQSLAFMRADFVSRVSHELRTPLAQIMMFAQTLMLGRVRSNEERRRSLEVIDKEAQRLSHLVDNILQFSRIDRGHTKVNIVSHPIYPLVHEIVDQFELIMQEGQLEMTSTVDSGVEVMLDVDAFRQMFLNLLDNAVKFSPVGEKIDVKLSESSNRVDLSIEDRGVGIPIGSRDRIWEPYYRAHDGMESAVGGTGIGLTIVRELARLQDISVAVIDREGGGSQFVISFEIENKRS